MTSDAWITAGVVLAVLAGLAINAVSTEVVVLSGLVVLLVTGVLEPAQAFAGFSNPGLVTIAALFVVAAALDHTGVTARVSRAVLGERGTPARALPRLVFPVAALSGFLNNTPLVAGLIPGVLAWCRSRGVAPSRLLLPMSYAATLGGTLTLIGTSTNLVVQGLVQRAGRDDLPPFGLFDVTPVGAAITFAGALVLVVLAPRLLPDRRAPLGPAGGDQRYTGELRVPERAALVGKTIAEAGLRGLEGVYLADVVRDGRRIPAVGPDQRLLAGDRLLFVGRLDALVDLRRSHGLEAPVGAASSAPRRIVEAVVAPGNPLLGKSIRESNFRATYDAIILAVARHGERIEGRIGDHVLDVGDVLLLEAAHDADRLPRGDFYLVSAVDGADPPRLARAPRAVVVLLALVLAVVVFGVDMLHASLVAAGAVLILGCLDLTQARRAVQGSLLLAIASAFALGAAMESSGLAAKLAQLALDVGASSPHAALAILFVLVAALTELVTNNAAAVLGFPLALELADRLGASPVPFVVVVMMAASASFLTPIGYQTNLMVYGPGGYKLRDYLTLGGVLSLVSAILVLLLVPWVFPF
ncbi:MAG: SLC13 family permease [Sandaracinus sp.]|nr:SLC13 family permease [Sandaracinus sp.]MCB9614009.1 SLC13 family permease [Sandaracinus sp.]